MFLLNMLKLIDIRMIIVLYYDITLDLCIYMTTSLSYTIHIFLNQKTNHKSLPLAQFKMISKDSRKLADICYGNNVNNYVDFP